MVEGPSISTRPANSATRPGRYNYTVGYPESLDGHIPRFVGSRCEERGPIGLGITHLQPLESVTVPYDTGIRTRVKLVGQPFIIEPSYVLDEAGHREYEFGSEASHPFVFSQIPVGSGFLPKYAQRDRLGPNLPGIGFAATPFKDSVQIANIGREPVQIRRSLEYISERAVIEQFVRNQYFAYTPDLRALNWMFTNLDPMVEAMGPMDQGLAILKYFFDCGLLHDHLHSVPLHDLMNLPILSGENFNLLSRQMLDTVSRNNSLLMLLASYANPSETLIFDMTLGGLVADNDTMADRFQVVLKKDENGRFHIKEYRDVEKIFEAGVPPSLKAYAEASVDKLNWRVEMRDSGEFSDLPIGSICAADDYLKFVVAEDGHNISANPLLHDAFMRKTVLMYTSSALWSTMTTAEDIFRSNVGLSIQQVTQMGCAATIEQLLKAGSPNAALYLARFAYPGQVSPHTIKDMLGNQGDYCKVWRALISAGKIDELGNIPLNATVATLDTYLGQDFITEDSLAKVSVRYDEDGTPLRGLSALWDKYDEDKVPLADRIGPNKVLSNFEAMVAFQLFVSAHFEISH